jgi:hypothetical protein
LTYWVGVRSNNSNYFFHLGWYLGFQLNTSDNKMGWRLNRYNDKAGRLENEGASFPLMVVLVLLQAHHLLDKILLLLFQLPLAFLEFFDIVGSLPDNLYHFFFLVLARRASARRTERTERGDNFAKSGNLLS